MRLRHLLALGAVFGAFGTADLSRAQAQAFNQQGRFVHLLLLKESVDIRSAANLIGRQNNTESRINLLVLGLSTESTRQFRRAVIQIGTLQRSATQLQGSINALAARLAREDFQLLTTVTTLPATTPNLNALTNQAFANNIIIAGILARPPFGITPVSPSS